MGAPTVRSGVYVSTSPGPANLQKLERTRGHIRVSAGCACHRVVGAGDPVEGRLGWRGGLPSPAPGQA